MSGSKVLSVSGGFFCSKNPLDPMDLYSWIFLDGYNIIMKKLACHKAYTQRKREDP